MWTLQANSSLDMKEPGLIAHCRRVAALGHLMAAQRRLSAEESTLLQNACLLHHHDAGIFSPAAVSRLLEDLGEECTVSFPAENVLPEDVRGVLHACEVPGTGSVPERRLAEIIRLADAFDLEMEGQPLGCSDIGAVLGGLQSGAEAGLWSREALAGLLEALRPQDLGAPDSWRVPMFPQAAAQMLTMLRDPRVSISRLVEVAGRDPSTAGLVMQLANSAMFGSRSPASTLAQAIVRLGLETAWKVILSAALRPLLASASLEALWPHSLEVADLAEQLADRTGAVDPAEAYLAGLLHDIGRIAFQLAPSYNAAPAKRLEQQGCPQLYAERLVVHTDHAALGASIAQRWRLPEDTVLAIQRHHSPEIGENRLAHVLYLSEYLSESEEDLPSRARLEQSLEGLSLGMGQIDEFSTSSLSAWLAAS